MQPASCSLCLSFTIHLPFVDVERGACELEDESSQKSATGLEEREGGFSHRSAARYLCTAGHANQYTLTAHHSFPPHKVTCAKVCILS